MTAENLAPVAPYDRRVFLSPEITLRDGPYESVRAKTHAFPNGRAWLGLSFGTLDLMVSASAASMRELGEALIAAAEASERAP